MVRFPDAPTERGVKHLKELQKALSDGYRAIVFFVIQMGNVKYFEPNSETHKEFADTLKSVVKNGVEVLAFDCDVTSDSIEINNPVEVRI